MAETNKHILALEVIAFKTIGEIAHPTFTKTNTIVVAKLTEFFGALQSSQLYIYGTERPKPIPKIKLPIEGKTQSLNVSVACGAVLYEAVRQKIGKGV